MPILTSPATSSVTIPRGARDAAFTHAAGDDSGMAGCPAVGGQKANGCIHAVDIIGGRLLAYENDRRLLMFAGELDGTIGRQGQLAYSRARRGRQAFGNCAAALRC